MQHGSAATGIVLPKSNRVSPIERAPFIGYPLTCAITFTFSGIRSDSRARVVRRDGTPIEGRYAAGEVAESYGGSDPAGTTVLRTLTFGRLAARGAADRGTVDRDLADREAQHGLARCQHIGGFHFSSGPLSASLLSLWGESPTESPSRERG
jgi:succinate dehydrogenase/fumarate reductase flavoprotein subunit